MIAEPFYFHIPYRSDCQVRRERVLQNAENGQNLTAGITYSTVIIVQHHKLFVTNRDKAYSITCFYKDGRNTFEQSVQVGDLTTQPLEGADRTPTCRYEVLSGGINGQPVRFANIGDQLIHKWTCDSEGMGMLVHSCFVRDGVGSEFALLDDRGCVTDISLLQPLTYTASLNSSYTPISAFKFADQMIVYFSCQITLCNKRDNGCEGITPPTCEYTPLPSEGGPSMPIDNGSDVQRSRDFSGGLIFSSSATASTPTRSFFPATSSTKSQSQFPGDFNSFNQQNTNHRPSHNNDNFFPYDSNASNNLHNQQNGQNRYHYESKNTYANQPHSSAKYNTSASSYYATSTTAKPFFAASGADQSNVYSSTELLGKPPTAYNIFRGGASVAAARHARATTHIPTSTAIHFDPKNNGSKSGNATKIIVDVAAERLIIFTKDEGMDEKTQKLMAGNKECNLQTSLFDPLWIGIVFVIFLFGISALIVQRTYYQRQFNEYISNSPSKRFGSPFEMAGFCRMTSTDTAHNSPSLTRLQHRC